MNEREKRIERHKQNRLETLNTNDPVCIICVETHWNTFERHHVAGCRYCEITATHCKNCHAKATALQKGHPPPQSGEPCVEERIARLLLGLADFFELLIETLRSFGEELLERIRTRINEAGTAAPTIPKA